MRRVGGWAAGRAASSILPPQRAAAGHGFAAASAAAPRTSTSAGGGVAPLAMGARRSYCDEEELSPFAEKVIKAEALPDGRYKFYFDVRFIITIII